MTRYERACAAVIRNGAILMVYCQHGSHAHWTLPGGGIEPEETAEQAVVRELWEEAGLRGEAPRFLYRRPWGREQKGDVEYCFLVYVSADQEAIVGSDPELVDGSQELTVVAWRPLEEVRDDAQVSRVLEALAILECVEAPSVD